MGGLVVWLFLMVVLLGGLAVGGIAAGRGERAAARVRALAATALLLTAVGYGVLLLAGGMEEGSFSNGLSFVALWGGVVLGTLVAMIACAGGVAYAARTHDQRWLRALVVGSLVPLALCVILVSVARTAQPSDAAQDARGAVVALLVALVLAALSPLAPLIYGARMVHREAQPSEVPLATLDS